MLMKAKIEAARAICLATAVAADLARTATNPVDRDCSEPAPGAADADRQGLVDRHGRRGGLGGAAGAGRHGLHRGDRRGAVLPRRPHPADLRGHQRHPGDRPDGPQAGARQRRGGARAGRRHLPDRRRAEERRRRLAAHHRRAAGGGAGGGAVGHRLADRAPRPRPARRAGRRDALPEAAGRRGRRLDAGQAGAGGLAAAGRRRGSAATTTAPRSASPASSPSRCSARPRDLPRR